MCVCLSRPKTTCSHMRLFFFFFFPDVTDSRKRCRTTDEVGGNFEKMALNPCSVLFFV